MRKLILLFVFILILPIVLSTSDFNYSELGFLDNNYRSAEGEFNEQVNEIYKTKTLSGSSKYPIVSDFDNDGDNDIFILDGQTAKIFNFDGTSLDLVDSYVLPTDERVSNIISFDIDGDNLIEIIFMQEASQILQILEYNGTDFFNQTGITFPHSATDLHTLIKCGDVDKCMLAWGGSFNDIGAETIFVSPFNDTKIGGNFSIDNDVTSGDHFCFPQIKNMMYIDFDNDGENEYIFSMILAQQSANEELNIYAVDEHGTLDYQIRDTLGNPVDASSTLCGTNNAGRYITSPLVFDFVTGGIKEIAIGGNVDDNEFKIFLYNGIGCSDNDNCLDDEFPKAFQSNGKILGNPILADVFSDSGVSDFCVFGYDNGLEELTLLCGSKNTNSFLGFLDSMEFVYATDGQYNLSTSFDGYSILGHSGQHKTQATQIGFNQDTNSNPDEFIISYGVFEVQDVTFNGSTWRKTLTRTFQNTRGESAIIPVDFEEIGANDLIGLQSTNLIYIDDGLSTAPSEITFWEINPCPIDTILKLNTTMDVSVIVTDLNPDLIGADPVSARITIYHGDINAQNQTLNNFTSGAEFQAVNFQLNKTIVNGNIRLEGWDTSHPTTIDIIDISFSVATNGLEFNDVTCSEIIAITEEEEEEATEEQQAINELENSITSVFRTFNLPFPIDVIWLIVMVIVAVTIWVSGGALAGSVNPTISFGVILLSQFLLLMIGVMLGFLSTGILIGVIVVGLIIIGLWAGSIMTGTRA